MNQTENQRRQRTIATMSLIISGSAMLVAFIFLWLYYEIGAWQILITASITIVGSVLFLIPWQLARRGRFDFAAYLIMGLFFVLLPLSGAFWHGALITMMVGSLIIPILIGSLVLPRHRRSWAVWVALLATASVILLDRFAPWPRFDVTQAALLNTVIIGAFSLLIFIILWQLFAIYRRSTTLRTRLLTIFALLVLTPTLLIGIISSLLAYYNGQNQGQNHLSSIATLKETEFRNWVENLHNDINSATTDEINSVTLLRILLENAPNTANYRLASRQLTDRFNQILPRNNLESLFVIDASGQIIFTTDPELQDRYVSGRNYFVEGRAQQDLYIQTSPGPVAPTEPIIMVMAYPIRNDDGETIGVLAGKVNRAKLNQMMQAGESLGETGRIYLVDNEYTLLTNTPFAGYKAGQTDVQSEGTTAALNGNDGAALYTDYEAEAVIGAYRWLPEYNLALVVEQLQAEAFQPTYNMLTINLGLAGLAVIVAGSVSFFVARSIARPVTELAHTAGQISEGNLELRAKVEREDEIGSLALAFNNMTDQLYNLIDSLEAEITSRTRRLEVIVAMSERLSAILNLEELMMGIVNQVKNQFGYYHAHIYLLDEAGLNLTVAAGTGQAGEEMRANRHSIPLAARRSLVARAARTRQVIRVDNVRQAEDWLPNPLLPDTYSEMAVPIMLEERMLGVLDVQENKIGGLDETDANTLRFLASLVAVALRNARLFQEIESTLNEARQTEQRYIEQNWDRDQVIRESRGRVTFNPDGDETLDETTITTTRQQALAQSGPTILPDHTLAMPVNLRQTAIGNLQLHPAEPDREWSESELALIEAVIDQVAQTAENLRLISQAQERASREQLIGRINDRLRSAADLETLFQIGVEEINRVLNPTRTFVQLGANETDDQGDES